MTSLDISCANYNKNYNNAINQIAQTSAANRTWTRVEGFNNNPLIANTLCGGISSDIQQRFLNKKKYIFSNNRNNVQSGNKNRVLTKAQIYSRVARGYTPQGRPAPGYGVQTSTITDPNPFNLPRFDNRLVTSCCSPTGGNISEVGDYRLHTFTSNGGFIFSGYGCPSLVCDIVLVGGGAGGGSTQDYDSGGGGGGGGEVKILSNYTLLPGSYNIIIGKGGPSDKNGLDTVMFKVYKAKGGSTPNSGTGGNSGGTSGSDLSGGNPVVDLPPDFIFSMGGGGGGSAGDGGDASYNFAIDPSSATGGNGGKGTELDATWTGEIIYLGYGGGGGGGSIIDSTGSSVLPLGQDPSGGFGGWYENDSSISGVLSGNGAKGSNFGFNALYSYGGGGGGGSKSNSIGSSYQFGGRGGNGVVFIRYKVNF